MMLATAITVSDLLPPGHPRKSAESPARLSDGRVPCIIWDNITRRQDHVPALSGHARPRCMPAACSASPDATVAASAIHLFTGNNIMPAAIWRRVH